MQNLILGLKISNVTNFNILWYVLKVGVNIIWLFEDRVCHRDNVDGFKLSKGAYNYAIMISET